MKIAIGSDHKGFALKEYIKQNLHDFDIKWIDVGTDKENEVDFPVYTLPVCLEVLQGSADFGILLCSTGIGMSILANRFSHIYAGIAWNSDVARLNKEHNNVNILIIPAEFVTKENCINIINSWLNAEFKGLSYQKRIDMIDSLGLENDIKKGCC